MSCRAFLNVPKSIAHHWITVLVTCVLIGGAGLPVIWLLVEPYCVVRGTIHVAPSLRSILTGEPDGSEISDYDSYMNTQAVLITSGRVLERVADDLAPRGLALFNLERPVGVVARLKRKLGIEQIFEEPSDILKADITAGTISAEPMPKTELIGVTMKYPDEREAKVIVDSFLRQFENSYGAQIQKDMNNTLRRLDDQERKLEQKIRRQQDELLQLAREYGTTAFDSRQEMALQRERALAAELTRLETRRIHLEAKMAVQAVAAVSVPESIELQLQRERYVNADPSIQTWARRVAEYEADCVVAPVAEPNEPPALTEQLRVQAAFKARLAHRREERESQFDEMVRRTVKDQPGRALQQTKMELEEAEACEDRLRDVLMETETSTRRLGVAAANLQRLQLDLDLDRQLYEQVTRRLHELELQIDRQSRVSIAYGAELASTVDSRGKLTATVWIAGLLAGMLLAVVRGPWKVSR